MMCHLFKIIIFAARLSIFFRLSASRTNDEFGMRSILYHMTSLLGTSHLLPGGGPGTFRGGGVGFSKGSTGGGSEIKNHWNGGGARGRSYFIIISYFIFFRYGGEGGQESVFIKTNVSASVGGGLRWGGGGTLTFSASILLSNLKKT